MHSVTPAEVKYAGGTQWLLCVSWRWVENKHSEENHAGLDIIREGHCKTCLNHGRH